MDTETFTAKDSLTIGTSLRTLLRSFPGIRDEEPSTIIEAENVQIVCRAIQSAALGIRFSLLGQWNALQHINQLPNEVLHDILKIAFADEGIGYIRRPTGYFARQQALRKVSSRWNQIISTSPYFWNTLCCTDTGKERFEIALEKSRNAGLHVICRSSNHCRRFAERVGEVSHRWKSLDILYKDYWNNQLRLPTPMLINLRVNAQCLPLPALPTQHAQGLSVVLVQTTSFRWEIVPATGLRALELTSVWPGLRLEQLLDVVATNPGLERLSIRDMYMSASRPTTKLPTVTALNLRYIGFPTPATSEALIEFLAHLIIPPSCAVHIRMYAGEVVGNVPGLIERLFRYTCERVNQQDQSSSVEVRLDPGYWRGVVLSCPPTNPTIFVRFSWWLYRLSSEEGLRAIADQLKPAFRGMRELRFSGLESTLGPWSLPKILGLWAQCLPQPSRLAVPSDSWALDHLKNLQEYGWAYPNLQHLRLLGGEWKPQLVELLANRRAESAVEAIETIVLENIHVGPQHLEAMKALVNEVVVETLE